MDHKHMQPIEILRRAGTAIDNGDFVEFERLKAQFPEVFELSDATGNARSAIRDHKNDELEALLIQFPSLISAVDEPLLHNAATHNNIEACKLLLSAGADMLQRSSRNNSVLDHAKLSPDLYSELLAAGADPNARAVFHAFTMYQAVDEETRLQIVKILVDHGLEINRGYLMFDDPNSIQTVLDFIGDGFPQCHEWLVKQGAKSASSLANIGAYNSSNEFLSFEVLEQMRGN